MQSATTIHADLDCKLGLMQTAILVYYYFIFSVYHYYYHCYISQYPYRGRLCNVRQLVHKSQH